MKYAVILTDVDSSIINKIEFWILDSVEQQNKAKDALNYLREIRNKIKERITALSKSFIKSGKNQNIRVRFDEDISYYIPLTESIEKKAEEFNRLNPLFHHINAFVVNNIPFTEEDISSLKSLEEEIPDFTFNKEYREIFLNSDLCTLDIEKENYYDCIKYLIICSAYQDERINKNIL